MYISQCCGCPCDVDSPGQPIDDMLTICPDCQEWTTVEDDEMETE